MDGIYIDYKKRAYQCPNCACSGVGYKVLQKAPPEFLLQPHPMYPMSRKAFDYWTTILRVNFPDHPRVGELGKEFYPNTTGTFLSNNVRWATLGILTGVAIFIILIKILGLQ